MGINGVYFLYFFDHVYLDISVSRVEYLANICSKGLYPSVSRQSSPC